MRILHQAHSLNAEAEHRFGVLPFETPELPYGGWRKAPLMRAAKLRHQGSLMFIPAFAQSLGGITVALPFITTSPFWLVQTVSRIARFFSGMSSATVTVAVIVSPKKTGLVKRSS